MRSSIWRCCCQCWQCDDGVWLHWFCQCQIAKMQLLIYGKWLS